MGFLVPRAPEGSTGRLVLIDDFGEARDRACHPWFTRGVAYPLHHGGLSSVLMSYFNTNYVCYFFTETSLIIFRF